MPEVYTVRLADIEFEHSTQTRVAINNEVVAEYAAAMHAGEAFPPVSLFQSPTRRFYIGDGWHRLIAAHRNGVSTIPAYVENGGREAALRAALGANSAHGLPRTNADKRHAVLVALKEFPKLSDREIAKACNVSHPFVGNVRVQVETLPPETRIGADGKAYPAPQPAKNAESATPGPKDEGADDWAKDELGEEQPETTAAGPQEGATPPGDAETAAAAATPTPPAAVPGEFGNPPPEDPPPPWSLERETARIRRLVQALVAAAPEAERDAFGKAILAAVVELYGEPEPVTKPEAKAKPAKQKSAAAQVAEIYKAFPRKVAPQAAHKAIAKALATVPFEKLLASTKAYAAAVGQWPAAERRQFVPHPATWFNRGSYDDDQSEWKRGAEATKARPFTM